MICSKMSEKWITQLNYMDERAHSTNECSLYGLSIKLLQIYHLFSDLRSFANYVISEEKTVAYYYQALIYEQLWVHEII